MPGGSDQPIPDALSTSVRDCLVATDDPPAWVDFDRVVRAYEFLVDRGHDLRATLEGVGLHLLSATATPVVLRRLLSAEINQFPDLLDIVHTRAADRVTEALADRLARLTVTGRLHTPDPLLAAEQFIAPLAGPIDKRARLGTRRVP